MCSLRPFFPFLAHLQRPCVSTALQLKLAAPLPVSQQPRLLSGVKTTMVLVLFSQILRPSAPLVQSEKSPGQIVCGGGDHQGTAGEVVSTFMVLRGHPWALYCTILSLPDNLRELLYAFHPKLPFADTVPIYTPSPNPRGYDKHLTGLSGATVQILWGAFMLHTALEGLAPQGPLIFTYTHRSPESLSTSMPHGWG